MSVPLIRRLQLTAPAPLTASVLCFSRSVLPLYAQEGQYIAPNQQRDVGTSAPGQRLGVEAHQEFIETAGEEKRAAAKTTMFTATSVSMEIRDAAAPAFLSR
jgi:hypothetical protein